MPETRPVAVKDLSLDLANYRTVRQPSEASAVAAMVSTSPDRFWALTESLLQDGYLPTENILVLNSTGKRQVMTVKEGNRRIAALKLILGLLPAGTVDPPDNVIAQLKNVSKKWRTENEAVPCAVYDSAEAKIVDRIVALAHGKGEKAGRDQWNAVARARHNRDASGGSEPALDLLEKYLTSGRNVTSRQKSQWAGDYPLSVLAEAMKRLAPRVGASKSPDLANAYPAIGHRDPFEAILFAIGEEKLGFDVIRQKDNDFALAYGMPAVKSAGSGHTGKTSKSKGGGTKAGSKGKPQTKPRALAITDPRAVRRHLKDFVPRGKKREKVETLRGEALDLDLKMTPLAFCFVLRSMFEISAKAYCSDNASSGLSATKQDGQDRHLAEVLRDITKHLTNNNTDKEMVKALHGAMAELGKSAGLLSVTSMNQLIHNPRFSITPSDIAILFGNIFPLLEAMNS